MKKIVLLLLLSSFAQALNFDVQGFGEAIAQSSSEERLMNARLFLKSSADSWEESQRDFAKLTPALIKYLVQARIQVGSELQQTYLQGSVADINFVTGKVRECQYDFAHQADQTKSFHVKPDISCFEHLKTGTRMNLGLFREAALLTLLLDRNPNISCEDIPVLSAQEHRAWITAVQMSPIYGSFSVLGRSQIAFNNCPINVR